MRDLRSELERLGERARPRSDAFERLERRRRRKERNHRIAAGAVAFIVAVAGSVAAFTVFRDTEPRVGGEGGAESYLAIWPESSYEDALAVQEAVDAGDQSLAWRLDADETALAFARDALGWSDAEIYPIDATFGGGTWVAVRRPPASCQGPQESGCRGPEVTIELVRPFGSEGIWSVVSARSDEFLEVPAAGSELVVGASLTIPVQPPTPAMYAAVVGLGACGGWERDVITPPDAAIALTVPDLPDEAIEGCDIALVVLHADASSFQAAGLGQQLLEYGLRTAVWGVLAIPLRLVPAVGPPAPDVAGVSCDPSGITIDTAIVRAQADGVHLHLNATDGTSFSITDAPDADGDIPVSSGKGFGPESGDDMILANVAPGRYLLTCRDTGPSFDVIGTASLEIVDPAGHYVPAEPECGDGSAWGMAPGYGEGTVGDRGDPLDVARARLTGLEDGDLVERAGYPVSAAEPVVRIVRDGVVVGKVQLFSDGQGGWLLSSLDGCGETQFGWSAEPTGVSGPVGEPGTVLLDLCGPVLVEEGNSIHSGTDLHVDGQDIDFDTSCLMAPAGERLTISFSNLDVAVQRNISVYTMTPCLRERLVTGVTVSCGNVENDLPIFSGEIITGVSEIVYELEPLDPGYYYFQDDVHPGANGVLVVE